MKQSNEITIFKDVQDFRNYLAKTQQAKIVNFFGGDKQKALKFLSAAVTAVEQTPELLKCIPQSLTNSLVKMASFNFMPSDVSGQAYIVPYRRKDVMEAKFQLGYRGWIEIIYRAGVDKIEARVVRENDEFDITDDGIVHKFDWKKSNKERGDIIGVYAIAHFRGQKFWEYMHIDDIKEHAKKYSKTFSNKDSAWNTSFEWMAKKTVIKQLVKLLPMTEEMQEAWKEDIEDDELFKPKRKKILSDEVKKDELKLGKDKEAYEAEQIKDTTAKEKQEDNSDDASEIFGE